MAGGVRVDLLGPGKGDAVEAFGAVEFAKPVAAEGLGFEDFEGAVGGVGAVKADACRIGPKFVRGRLCGANQRAFELAEPRIGQASDEGQTLFFGLAGFGCQKLFEGAGRAPLRGAGARGFRGKGGEQRPDVKKDL